MPALGQFEINRVVDREPEAFGETLCRTPKLDCDFGIEGDRQVTQEIRQSAAAARIDPLATLGHHQSIEHFRRPKLRRHRAALPDALQQCRRPRGALVLEAPGKRDRAIEHKAHVRPSLISSLILRLPRVTPRLSSRMPVTARRALSRSKPNCAGTIRATALPRLVITISSPCFTWSSR